MLTREMSHRVKNSLASVVGLLRVQPRARSRRKSRTPSRTPLPASPRSPRFTIICGAAPGSGSSTSPTSRASFAGSCRKRSQGKLHLRSSDDFGRQGNSAWPADQRACDERCQARLPRRTGEIRVSGERRGAELHVEVSDQGIGLPKDFDMDQPRASLGFKVIKSLLAQLDGRIAVASNTPKGVTVQLDLPLEASAA